MSSERDRLLALYRARVAGYAEVGDEFHGDWSAWCRTVLAHGGDLVVPPLEPEPDLDGLLRAAAVHGPPPAASNRTALPRAHREALARR